MTLEAVWLPLLWLLLPVAFLSGWLVARRRPGSPPDQGASRVPPEYFRGLNYLLNEQPDKAIEIFVRMAEVDSDTVETHLALGNLFRRRGEVDRAIRIHQNLIARSSLTREQRLMAMLELGMDYMRSGLLDRAEGLFRELVDTGIHVREALDHLLDIYQQERDWHNAIATARRLQVVGVPGLNPVLAHYHCELAEEALRAGRTEEARSFLRDALAIDTHCVRASLIEAGIEERANNPRQAIAAYRRIESQDSDYLPEIILPLQRCYASIGADESFREFLSVIVARTGGVRAQLLYAEMLAASSGAAAATDHLAGELRLRPSVSGITRLVELILGEAGDGVRASLAAVRDAAARLEQGRAVYRCIHCGFAARLLHWQCPSCKHWNSVKPVHGVEGD
ncbi:MAG: lipopolysaccharide assembly protein LapB [Gammaproteobacteria bacterium]|nr:lipopolysaccharide assembly protein LapB [Gammaproteobacteria bacterium]